MARKLEDLIVQCQRCRHRWLRRGKTMPTQCPKCKSKFWNRERIRKIARERRAVPAKQRG